MLRAGGLEATQWNGPVLSLDHGAVRRLGPDLLAETTDPAALVPRLRRTEASRPLGEVLQDQRLVAGIGNRWMSEALWAAALSPWLPVGEASDDDLLAVLQWARDGDAGGGDGAASRCRGVRSRRPSLPALR